MVIDELETRVVSALEGERRIQMSASSGLPLRVILRMMAFWTPTESGLSLT